MEESIRFYREVMGLELQGRHEIPENKAEIAFLGDKNSDARLELTHWKEKKDWTQGDELDHIAFAVPNMEEAIRTFKEQKVEIAMEPYSLKGSTTKIAFIKDPNEIWLEIIETG